MAKKNECYLCGGKLRDGYCPDCGLDNTKIQRKHYHLNEHYSADDIQEEQDTASEQYRLKTGQKERTENSFHKDERQKQKPRKFVMNTGKNAAYGMPISGKVKIAAAAFGLAVVGTVLIGNLAADRHPGFTVREESESEPESLEPYEKEMPETGEHYEIELEQGEYLAGVHFPEGKYTARLLEGRGGLSVDDFENGIYLWQSFGPDEEYEEVESLEDIRLYTGARLQLNDSARLLLTTENGQTEAMEAVENPLTEAFTLKKDKTMEVGEDIPAGVYDLHVASKWAVLRCRIPDDSYEEGYYENSYMLGGEDWGDTYRNLYLKDGYEITAEENTLELTPSRMIGSGDYDEYYRFFL